MDESRFGSSIDVMGAMFNRPTFQHSLNVVTWCRFMAKEEDTARFQITNATDMICVTKPPISDGKDFILQSLTVSVISFQRPVED